METWTSWGVGDGRLRCSWVLLGFVILVFACLGVAYQAEVLCAVEDEGGGGCLGHDVYNVNWS